MAKTKKHKLQHPSAFHDAQPPLKEGERQPSSSPKSQSSFGSLQVQDIAPLGQPLTTSVADSPESKLGAGTGAASKYPASPAHDSCGSATILQNTNLPEHSPQQAAHHAQNSMLKQDEFNGSSTHDLVAALRKPSLNLSTREVPQRKTFSALKEQIVEFTAKAEDLSTLQNSSQPNHHVVHEMPKYEQTLEICTLEQDCEIGGQQGKQPQLDGQPPRELVGGVTVLHKPQDSSVKGQLSFAEVSPNLFAPKSAKAANAEIEDMGIQAIAAKTPQVNQEVASASIEQLENKSGSQAKTPAAQRKSGAKKAAQPTDTPAEDLQGTAAVKGAANSRKKASSSQADQSKPVESQTAQAQTEGDAQSAKSTAAEQGAAPQAPADHADGAAGAGTDGAANSKSSKRSKNAAAKAAHGADETAVEQETAKGSKAKSKASRSKKSQSTKEHGKSAAKSANKANAKASAVSELSTPEAGLTGDMAVSSINGLNEAYGQYAQHTQGKLEGTALSSQELAAGGLSTGAGSSGLVKGAAAGTQNLGFGWEQLRTPQRVTYQDVDPRYLELLSSKYPNRVAAFSEIINLQAILNLPKGTEHFVSDIHGEYEAFRHILNNCSGVIKEKVDLLFTDLTVEQRADLCTLIYYPREVLKERENHGQLTDVWYRDVLSYLIRLCKYLSAKYTRSKVRKAINKDYAYIIDELLHAQEGESNSRALYHSKIIDTILHIRSGHHFVNSLCALSKRLAVDHLHVVGDIFDRGSAPDKVMSLLMDYHSLDIQWGNHDILWMGAACGSEACMATVLRNNINYFNCDLLESAYGISLRKLNDFAQKTYSGTGNVNASGPVGNPVDAVGTMAPASGCGAGGAGGATCTGSGSGCGMQLGQCATAGVSVDDKIQFIHNSLGYAERKLAALCCYHIDLVYQYAQHFTHLCQSQANLADDLIQGLQLEANKLEAAKYFEGITPPSGSTQVDPFADAHHATAEALLEAHDSRKKSGRTKAQSRGQSIDSKPSGEEVEFRDSKDPVKASAKKFKHGIKLKTLVSLLERAAISREAGGAGAVGAGAFAQPMQIGQDAADTTQDRKDKMVKAITVIALKLQGQLIMRNPEFKMDDRLLLNKINWDKGTVLLGDQEFAMNSMELPTIDPKAPFELSAEEAEVMASLKSSFLNSRELQREVAFLFSHGSIYKRFNGNLLYHGCIPMTETGEFKQINCHGQQLAGKALLDYCDAVARRAYDKHDERSLDFMYFLWCGINSPLSGRIMKPFERYFVNDKSTHVEPRDPYYSFYYREDTCRKVLEEFDLDPDRGHIINGHTPIKVKHGESPIRGNGKLFVIDGGLCAAYHETTGIAGYTLISSSHGMILQAHRPFQSTEHAIKHKSDIVSISQEVEHYRQRMLVANSDTGIKLQRTIFELEALLDAYRQGLLPESQNR